MDLQLVNVSHHHNSFSFERMVLKLATKVDEILDKLENWPDRIFNLSYIPLIAEQASVRLCHQQNSFSFDLMILKLAGKVDIGEISGKIKKTGQIG